MSQLSNAVCPKCGQRAPLVLRGIEARCSVCGALRLPFTAKALNLAGKPSRFGGTAARVIGWGVLAMGLTIALSVALLLQSLLPTSYVGIAVALPIAVLSLLVGLGLVLGGRKLARSGDAAAREARLQTIRALASHRGGSLTAADVARKLDLSEPVADELLTDLAKDPAENVSLELDDDGGIHFLFGLGTRALRVDPGSGPPGTAGPTGDGALRIAPAGTASEWADEAALAAQAAADAAPPRGRTGR